MDKKINVLDHGYVRLVDHMGNDLSIVRSARVSHNAEWRTGENNSADEKLIKYLYKNNHNTPFESVVFTFEVKAPIFVVRQWHRHRTQSYNEVSARYTQMEDVFYTPRIGDIGVQSDSNKQGRDTGHLKDANREKEIVETISRSNRLAYCKYIDLLGDGVPRELARSILPLSIYTRMFTTLNLHNLFKFAEERMSDRAQYEIRVYAQAIISLIDKIVPIAVASFKENLK